MKKLLVVATALLLSACSTMQPPRYSVSVDNIQKLKSYSGSVADVSLTLNTEYQSNCRLMGPIEPADGLSIPQFISKAFNDEFKMADKYKSGGVEITGEITKITFSSVEGLTNGYWDIGLKLHSSNGSDLTISNKYSFKSGFDAITACNATADALSPAVQDLIKAAISHPKFEALMAGS
jgi:hypothetical protein